MKRHEVAFTTDASGNATVYTEVTQGLVHAIRYEYNNAATGADFTITCGRSGQAIITVTDAGTSSVTWYPRAATATVANAAALYAAGGTAVLTPIPVADEAIKIVVAQGGNTLSGTLHIYVG